MFGVTNSFGKVIATATTFATALTSVTTAATAAGFECYRPEVAAGYTKNRQPQGNWGPLHNTNNFTYASVPGPDVFRHKNGRRSVGTRCKGLGYDHGELKVDFVGYEDWCVRYQAGAPQSIQAPSCPSGYTVDASGATCTRPAQASTWRRNNWVHGNWAPWHNTNNFTRATIAGPDVFRHRNGRRSIGTKCRNGEGTKKVDMAGHQDWCATFIPAKPALTVTAQCSFGHTLRPKQTGPIIGNAGSTRVIAAPSRSAVPLGTTVQLPSVVVK